MISHEEDLEFTKKEVFLLDLSKMVDGFLGVVSLGMLRTNLEYKVLITLLKDDD